MITPSGNKDRKHMKVLVKADITQLQLRGNTFEVNWLINWVDFRYERCPNFSYNSGPIGCGEKNYSET